jgi:hypothetical protein
MSHSIEEATAYVGRFLTALHADDVTAFEATYEEALATSDGERPLFRIVNILVGNLVNAVANEVASEYSHADDLIKDALKDTPDPWAASLDGDTK